MYHWSKKVHFFACKLTLIVTKMFGDFVKMTLTRFWSHLRWLESNHSAKKRYLSGIIKILFLNMTRVTKNRDSSQVDKQTRVTPSQPYTLSLFPLCRQANSCYLIVNLRLVVFKISLDSLWEPERKGVNMAETFCWKVLNVMFWSFVNFSVL